MTPRAPAFLAPLPHLPLLRAEKVAVPGVLRESRGSSARFSFSPFLFFRFTFRR